MNKKRKILTLVALAVFGVIIMLRCSGLPAYHHSYWKNADVFDKIDKNTVTRTVASNAPADAPDWARAPLVEALVPGYWSWARPPLYRDFYLSLFALAVFYAGLFAVLGDNKRKEQ